MGWVCGIELGDGAELGGWGGIVELVGEVGCSGKLCCSKGLGCSASRGGVSCKGHSTCAELEGCAGAHRVGVVSDVMRRIIGTIAPTPRTTTDGASRSTHPHLRNSANGPDDTTRFQSHYENTPSTGGLHHPLEGCCRIVHLPTYPLREG